MAKNYKSNKILTTLLCIFAVFVFVVLLCGVLSRTFSVPLTVTCGGSKFTGKDNALILPHNGEVRFDISGADKYSVEVLPNIKTAESDFIYSVNGNDNYKFSGDDYTNLFVYQWDIHNDYFIINCSVGRYSIVRLLSNLWNGAEIILPELTFDYYFKLVVTSSESVVEIDLAQIPVMLTGDDIIF